MLMEISPSCRRCHDGYQQTGPTTCKKRTVLLALERREHLGLLLEMNGFTSGVELGVQVYNAGFHACMYSTCIPL